MPSPTSAWRSRRCRRRTWRSCGHGDRERWNQRDAEMWLDAMRAGRSSGCLPRPAAVEQRPLRRLRRGARGVGGRVAIPGRSSTSTRARRATSGDRCCGSGTSRCAEAPATSRLARSSRVHSLLSDGKVIAGATLLSWPRPSKRRAWRSRRCRRRTWRSFAAWSRQGGTLSRVTAMALDVVKCLGLAGFLRFQDRYGHGVREVSASLRGVPRGRKTVFCAGERSGYAGQEAASRWTFRHGMLLNSAMARSRAGRALLEGRCPQSRGAGGVGDVAGAEHRTRRAGV